MHLEDLSMKHDFGEHNDFEIDPRIYEHYLSLLPPSGPNAGSSNPNTRSQICGRGLPLHESPPTQSYITRFWSLSEPLQDLPDYVDLQNYYTATLLESRTTIEGGTTGLRTWFASYVLSQYLIMHPESIISKCVLELGSGVGFLGIIVATLQQLSKTNFRSLSNVRLPDLSPGSLWLSDLNDEVLNRCRDNLYLPCNISSSHPDLNYLKLDWSGSIDFESASEFAALLHQKIAPDIILGADVAFDPSVIPALVGTLKIALQTQPKVALIALTVRNKATFEKFLNHAREASLLLEDIELGFHATSFLDTVEDMESCRNVKIFRITYAA
ncbi:hypothetical protein BYT27DRAFT_7190107 [Phlegmacium glaucopus]|nr:hypothetical protein BYT27DRAFT_7190107 [Phlegmacium glaucopus]